MLHQQTCNKNFLLPDLAVWPHSLLFVIYVIVTSQSACISIFTISGCFHSGHDGFILCLGKTHAVRWRYAQSWFTNHQHTWRRRQLQHPFAFAAVQSVSAAVQCISMFNDSHLLLLLLVRKKQPSGQLANFKPPFQAESGTYNVSRVLSQQISRTLVSIMSRSGLWPLVAG